MLENSEELAITPVSAPKLPAKNTSNHTRNVQLVEELLGKSASPQEGLDWSKVRLEVLRQNEYLKEENHQRVLEKTRLIYGIVFSSVVFVTGSVLFICHYDNAFYLIAVGLVPLLARRKST